MTDSRSASLRHATSAVEYLSHPLRILVVEAGAEETTVENETIRIDCGECTMQHTSACDDCVVSFIVNRSPGDAVVIDAAEERAVRMLAGAGLVPSLRHIRRVS